MDLMIGSLADRPDLAPIFDLFPDSWAEFLYHDPVTERLFDRLVALHPESNLIAIDRDAPDRPVARACAFPFRWAGDPDKELPPGGYDRVLLDGFADRDRPRGPIAAALEITIRPDMRGSGLSRVMLDALRDTLRGLGYTSLVAPVRPNEKHRWPHESMDTYLTRFRPDGLPQDAWLRTHVRAGARVVGVAPYSMTVLGTLAEWRGWTGLPFDESGPVLVPQGLVPVYCDVEHEVGTYVEPNVWMHHRL
jgi:GNAT superfamily N-acetyltransferase